MKKLKLLSFAVLPLALGILASCGENTDAKVKVNSGDDKVMAKLEKEQDADYEEWFKLENQNLKAGDSLSFTYKGNDVSEKVIPEIVLPGNNLDEDLKIVNDADAAFITLKVYKDDVYSAFVSGFVAPEPDKYTVSKADVVNGTLSLSKEGELVEGDQVTATATAAEGYALKEITINGESASTTSPYTFTVAGLLADDQDKIVVGATFKVASDPYKIANQDEWTAAFGADKTFFIADNCKIELESSGDSAPTSNTTFIIDGNKMEEIENGQSTYASYENGTYYAYTTLQPQNVWTKNATTKEHVQAEITRFFEPFADMSVFTYDETTHTYVASEVTIEGVYFEEAKVNFENGKLMAVYGKAIQELPPSLRFAVILDGTITHGGQSVTLPQVDPEPEPKGLKIEGLEEVWVGDTLVLTASALPKGSTLKDEVTWSIDSGEDYVSLPETKTGTSIEVTGVSAGNATIKAVCGTLPAAFHIIEIKDSPAPVKSDFQLLLGEEAVNLEPNEKPLDPTFLEWYVMDVTVLEGTRLQVIDNTQDPAVTFTIKNIKGATEDFMLIGEEVICQNDGEYDFYLKLKPNEDEIYIDNGIVVPSDFQMLLNDEPVNLIHNDFPMEGYDEWYVREQVIEKNTIVRFQNNTVTPAEKFDVVGIGEDSPAKDAFNMEHGSLVCKASGTFDVYLKLKSGEDIVYISGNFKPVVETEFGATINGSFQKLGTNPNKTYNVESDFQAGMVIGVASRTDGAITNLSVPKSGLTYDENIFEYNEQNSTLTVKKAGHYYFAIEFENGLVKSLSASSESPNVTVKFTVNKDVGFGNAVYAVGDMSGWVLDPKYQLECSDDTIWSKSFTVPNGTIINFKLAIGAYGAEKGAQPSEWEWQGEPNRTYTFTANDDVTLTWGTL